MNEFQLLQLAGQYADGQPNIKQAQKWLTINNQALQAYDKVRNRAPNNLRSQLPTSSPEMLKQCDPSDIPAGLQMFFDQFHLRSPRLACSIREYIRSVRQLIEQSRQIVEVSRDSNAGPSSGVQSPAALYETPDELQQRLTQQVEGTRASIEQLILVAADAKKQVNLLRQDMERVSADYMPKGAYERTFGELYVLKETQERRWKELAQQIIEIICDLELQYNPNRSQNSTGVQGSEQILDRAILTVVHRLEALLTQMFGVYRIPAEQNAEFNPETMLADRYEEESPAPEMAGRIARVIEPGYWRKRPNGTSELYHRVLVRRYENRYQKAE